MAKFVGGIVKRWTVSQAESMAVAAARPDTCAVKFSGTIRESVRFLQRVASPAMALRRHKINADGELDGRLLARV